jgi:Tfp pilus tip-associated adhesin PilY1
MVLGSSWLLRCCLTGACSPALLWTPPSGAALAAAAAWPGDLQQYQLQQQQAQAESIGYGWQAGLAVKLQQLQDITAAARLQQQATNAGTA